MAFPLVVRMPYGGGVRAPELHDDSPETYYVHTPGVKVAIPSTPADAKGILAAAIRDPDPVVVLEPKLHYRTLKGEVPEGEHVVPLGKARLAREGDDVTLVAYGSMVPLCRAGGRRARRRGSVEVLDIRTLKPLDEDALLASAAKTGRVVIVQEAPRDVRVRCGAGGDPRREGDPRPARARCCASPATTCRTRTGRSRTRTCPRSSASSPPCAGCSSSELQSDRTSCPLERRTARAARRLVRLEQALAVETGRAVTRATELRLAATPRPVSSTRIRVDQVAGVSYRLDACRTTRSRQAGGSRSCAEPDNEHDPHAIGIWDESERGCRAATSRPRRARELDADDWQAVSLWEFFEDGRRGGLRVLLAPRDAWIGRREHDPRAAARAAHAARPLLARPAADPHDRQRRHDRLRVSRMRAGMSRPARRSSRATRSSTAGTRWSGRSRSAAPRRADARGRASTRSASAPSARRTRSGWQTALNDRLGHGGGETLHRSDWSLDAERHRSRPARREVDLRPFPACSACRRARRASIRPRRRGAGAATSTARSSSRARRSSFRSPSTARSSRPETAMRVRETARSPDRDRMPARPARADARGRGRPRARDTDRLDSGRLDDVRLRRGSRRGCGARDRRDARADGSRARDRTRATRSRSRASSSTCA